MSEPIELRVEDVYRVNLLAEPEGITFKPPFSLAQIRELERVWVETPRGRRLEAVGAKAAELGVEIESMRRGPMPTFKATLIKATWPGDDDG